MTRELTNEFIAPDFAGFYDSIYTPEFYADMYELADDADIYDWVYENVEYDYREYEKQIATQYIYEVENALREYLPHFRAEFREVDSPAYYNFETDKAVGVCNLEDIREDIKAYISKYPNEFKKWIKDNHSSYDGFISFYSNDVNDWDLDSELDHNELGSIFGFILTNEHIIGYNCDWDLNARVYDSGINPDWYIDTDKINNDFKFTVPVESLWDLQYYRKNNDGVYEWIEDCEGQLKLAV